MKYGKNNFYLSKTFMDGIVAEFFVMDHFRNKGCEVSNEASYPQSDANHDLDIICEGNHKTCEVKVAFNKKNYPTHFAEIISTGAMCYAEYLVFPPDLIVYADTYNKKIYLYDGKKFASAVKSKFCEMFPNYNNSAYGIKFGKQSKEFGFLQVCCIKDIMTTSITKNEEAIKDRLLASKDVYVDYYRECDGLPDLNEVFNINVPCPDKSPSLTTPVASR
jgi:hypothetical protein